MAIGIEVNMTQVSAQLQSNFPTRASMVSARASGWVPTVGTTYTAGGFRYLAQSGAAAISDLPGLVPDGDAYPQHFGAVANGVANDRAAIQAAVNYAPVVHFRGDYFVSGGAYDAVADWRHHIVITKPNELRFESGKIITNTPFASRAVLFLVRSSDVRFYNLQTLDTLTSASNWIIPIGAGRSYDGSFPNETLRGLRVYGGEFVNAWLSVTVQFGTSSSGNMGFRDILVQGAISRARAAAVSSGNFNFRSDGPWRVGDVRCVGCSAYDGKSASSFNYYGVDGGSHTGCTSYRNTYAGSQMENGTQDIVITGFTSVDDLWGLWIDDSRRITVNGYTHKTLSETVSNSNESLGTFHRTRPGLMITRQGFTDYTDWVTTDIVISGMVSDFGRVVTQGFGADPAGAFGRIVIDGLILRSDGVARETGNTQVAIAGSVPDLTIANARIGGGTGRNIELNIPANGLHVLQNVQTFTVASETPVGLLTVGTGTNYLHNVRVRSIDLQNSGQRWRDLIVNGQPQPDRVGAVRQFWGFAGSPEGVYAAGVGSVYYRTDGGAGTTYYVKESGTGNTGWVAK